MKILILGGTGLLSSGITKKCLEKGYEVVHFNRGTTNVSDGIQQIKGNRYEKDELKRALQCKPDVVIDMLCFEAEHARLGVDVFQGQVDQYIYCSTSCVYTPRISENMILEDSETKPLTEYGQNKLAAEQIFRKAAEEGKFSTTIFRPGHVYGNDFLVTNLDFEGKFVLARMLQNKDVILTDGGKRKFQACHKDNIGNAFAECCGNKDAYGKIYNIAGEEFMDWNTVYEIEKSVLNSKSNIIYLKSEDVVREDRARFDFLETYTKYDWMQSMERLKSDLENYQYEVDFQTGIGQFIEDNYEMIKKCETNDQLYDKMISYASEQ